MAKRKKTLAMRILEGQNVSFEVIEYPETIHDAQGVAEYAGLPPESVYKTLVVEADDPDSRPKLIMIAADTQLDLKKTAQAIGERKVRMARQADAERMTGLKVGGISALALLNKGFSIYVDEVALLFDEITVSAGQRGYNLRLKVDDLIRVTGAEIIDASCE